MVRRYAEELRTIGQALEAKGVTGFELYNLRAGYFIKDLHEHRPSSNSTFRNWLRRKSNNGRQYVTYGFDFHEIEELSKIGRARRSNPGQLPQFRDQSNILRTVGAYLDSKEVQLTELHKRPISITVAYRDQFGHEYREDRPVLSFQEIFYQLCGQRSRTR
jgi:hypothetical protein